MTKRKTVASEVAVCGLAEGLISDLKANIYMKDHACSVCDNIVHLNFNSINSGVDSYRYSIYVHSHPARSGF